MDQPHWPDEGGKGLACARCDAWIQYHFPRPFTEIAHFFYGAEYVTLEPFPVILYCPQCSNEVETVGREMTINTDTGVIVRCKIDKVAEGEP